MTIAHILYSIYCFLSILCNKETSFKTTRVITILYNFDFANYTFKLQALTPSYFLYNVGLDKEDGLVVSRQHRAN
jgi:hypothetical protein